MEMNSPVGPNALDTQGVVGKPLDRVDGRLKVTGGARYAYEMQQENVLYGFVVEASIGKERSDRSILALRRRPRASRWFSPIATRPRRAPAITVKRTRCSPGRK
jgi:hypothetical protein